MRRLSEPFRPDRPAVSEVAAGAVVARDGTREVVLLHHMLEDRWCFPKGHLETGESILQAAGREVAEETGFREFRLAEELGEVSYRFYDPRRDVNVLKTTIYFLAFTPEPIPRPEPLFDRWEWLPLPAARARVEFDSERRVLDLAERRLSDVPVPSATEARGPPPIAPEKKEAGMG